jgi:hypothetical protein
VTHALGDFLLAALDRDDRLGLLARFLADDVAAGGDLPDGRGDVGDLAAHLRGRGAPADVLAAAPDAWREWEAQRGPIATPEPTANVVPVEDATPDEEAELDRVLRRFNRDGTLL